MSSRRDVLIGVGGALLGGAALAHTAGAAQGGSTDFIYAIGLVWNQTLPEPSGRLRLTVYLAVGGGGTGFGALSDPVYPQVNSHLRVLQTASQGNQYEFHGEITDSHTAGFIGQPFVILAVAHGDATILNLQLAGETYPGLGRVLRITNLRANASGLGVPAPLSQPGF